MILFVGTDDGKVWVTQQRTAANDGTDLSDAVRGHAAPSALGERASRPRLRTRTSPTVFVSFTGYREDIRDPYLFRSDDGGDSWRSLAGELPDEPINVIRQHPRAANVLLCGTEMGVYVSVDDGADWFPLGHGLPRVPVHDLVVHPTEPHVVLGTHGRGVFALDASLLEGLIANALRGGFAALPPSDGILLRRALDIGYRGARTWSADNPFVTPTFRYVLGQDSDDAVVIEVKDVTGDVLWRHEGSGAAGYHEVRWENRRRGRGGFQGSAASAAAAGRAARVPASSR